jgi:cation diffusion facilitator CzcD-associated flavoprotein CzcO
LSTDDRYRVVVVGGGPAGLATSAELTRRKIEHVVLEQGPVAGHTWANLYDSLTLHTGKHLSTLPGMSFDRRVPIFPSRRDFVEYLTRYVTFHAVPIRTGTPVRAVEKGERGWTVRTGSGSMSAGAVVVATGIVSAPRMPNVPGRDRFAGRVTHSVDYRRPAGFEGRRVLVVGVGNSGGEIGSELADAGAQVSVAVRSGANVVPLALAGIPIQYLAFGLRGLPIGVRRRIAAGVGKLTERRRGKPVLPKPPYGPLDAIPLIGFHLVDAIRAGRIAVRPGIASFTEHGVRFVDRTEGEFDDVIFATGFTAALAPLGDLVTTDAKGFASRRDRVVSTDQPNLYVVGHNYDATGGLYNIRRDARLAAERIAGSD